ncbi:hypothetical protein FHS29_007005 [Saccharothrix tamanrassetensis]|uniref:Uncharacterized protein n=1 Tax=Saccharothrix tamanrassetensis TaxID=1051531 RepID=A0A841CPN1_9PSEU|nr:hypothetical protein [Saccharothrix tamanrassetensis]MBB5960382.1 hypothetical protein [Saccharothrix tamanrassetensis]
MILPGGSGIPQWYQPVPPEFAGRVRSRCTTVGVPVVLADVVFGVLVVVLRDVPSTSYHLFHTGAVGAGVLSAFFSSLVGFTLAGSRSYARGDRLNMTGLGIARRTSLAMWVFSVVCTAIGWSITFMTLLRPARAPTLGGGVVAYAALLAAPPLVGLVAVAVTRSLAPRSSR